MASGEHERHPLASRLRGLLLARTLIVTIFLGATAITHTRIDSDPDFPLRAVVGLIVFAYLFSLASAAILLRTRRLRTFTCAQVGIDVAIISVAILLTGGLGSPMAVWYNLAIIAAAILLGRRGAFLTAALASVTYGSLMNVLYWEVLPETMVFSGSGGDPGFGIVGQVAANIGSFFSIAYLASILVERVAVTERALEISEATRHRIESFQKVLVQNLETGILTTDADGRIEAANHAIEGVLGRAATNIVGRNVIEIFPVLRAPVGSRRVLDPSPIPTEIRYENGTDSPRVLRCTRAPLTDTYENPIGMLLIFQDVTVLTELERRVRRSGEVPELPADPGEPGRPAVGGMFGDGPAMQDVARLIRKVAPTESTILITGESGTGKELAARAIHAQSSRRDKPMVVVNCAAIPENLIESELFGHVKGAFTGAVKDRGGLFRAADGGSIFLDEIGDLPLPMQVKLLRVLQERSFTPVGAQSMVAVDVRILAATNRELESDVAEGRFREDLFYRLNVIRIHLPPLRERREDLPALVNHFVNRFSESLGKPGCPVGAEAMRRLLGYDYPGNVRELENVVEHAIALCGGSVIEEADLPETLRAGSANGTSPVPGALTSGLGMIQAKGSNLDEELAEIERRLLQEALDQAGGVRKRAAEILGINYRSLRHRLEKYGFGDSSPKMASGDR